MDLKQIGTGASPNEIDLLDVLRHSKEVYIDLSNTSPAVASLVMRTAEQIVRDALILVTLKPLFAQMRFDMEAATRGAFPPVKID
jgi:hypothetical protein